MIFEKEIQTEVEIDAAPQIVWKVLTDLASYHDWNPHIVDASGVVEKGSTIRIRVEGTESRSRKASMNATVTIAESPRTLQWCGTAGSAWIFKGVHTFRLEPLTSERTRVINHERRSGLLTPIVSDDDSWRAYQMMNRALADRVEHCSAN